MENNNTQAYGSITRVAEKLSNGLIRVQILDASGEVVGEYITPGVTPKLKLKRGYRHYSPRELAMTIVVLNNNFIQRADAERCEDLFRTALHALHTITSPYTCNMDDKYSLHVMSDTDALYDLYVETYIEAYN